MNKQERQQLIDEVTEEVLKRLCPILELSLKPAKFVQTHTAMELPPNQMILINDKGQGHVINLDEVKQEAYENFSKIQCTCDLQLEKELDACGHYIGCPQWMSDEVWEDKDTALKSWTGGYPYELEKDKTPEISRIIANYVVDEPPDNEGIIEPTTFIAGEEVDVP